MNTSSSPSNPRKRFWRNASFWLRVVALVVPLLPLMLILPHVVGLAHYTSVSLVEKRLYDLRMQWFEPLQHYSDTRIVIVDIDEASLQSVGRWPWSREVMARISTELLERQRAAVVGFDVLFAEAERHTSVQRAIEALTQKQMPTQTQQRLLKELWQQDQQFAHTIRNKPVVLGFYVSNNKSPYQVGVLPPSVVLTNTPHNARFSKLHTINGYTGSVQDLVQAASAGGFINAFSDTDGVLRSVPLVMQQQLDTDAQPRYQTSLALRMFMMTLGVEALELRPVGTISRWAETLGGIVLHQDGRQLLLPTDPTGSMLVPYRGGGGPDAGFYRYISAQDLLAGKLPEGSLANKLVLVGTSAVGLGDIRVTPSDSEYPGVEVHASMLSAMLDGRFLYYPDYVRGYSFVTTVLAVLLLFLILPRVSIVGAFLACTLLVLAIVAANVMLYVNYGIAMPQAAGIVTVVLTYFLHASTGYFLESRSKNQLIRLFGHYIPAELTRRMAKSPATYDMRAHLQELSILFCDVTQFTRLSEQMSPEALQDMLNRLFDQMADVIAGTHGTIDKYIGDCIMVFWGAPLNDPHHALHAVQAGMRIQAMLPAFNAQQQALGQQPIHVGIGINTGVVSVGDIGSSIRRSYTVLGDAVNVAARLEPISKLYGVHIAVGERTAELAPDILWQWVDTTQLSGREQGTRVYTPLGQHPLPEPLQEEITLWQTYQNAYEQRQWADCQQALQPLLKKHPTKLLYRIHAKRIRHFLSKPPAADWDGVLRQRNKIAVA